MWNKLFIFAAICLSCSGCATFEGSCLKSSGIPETESAFLLKVPFVKQKKSFCGPAALSSVFAYWGYDYKQEDIAKDIYRKELCGVLNIDLENYAQERGLWAQGYRTSFDDIKEKLKHNIPVIALERLHPYAIKRLHYVVVVGVDEKHNLIFEHTGKKSFVARSFRGFVRNWQKAGYWILVVLPPEKVYWQINASQELELGMIFEKKGANDAALKHYEIAFKYEPDNPVVLFNLGNIYLQKNLLDQAEEKYLRALKFRSDFADCCNNLAYLYLKKNNFAQAHFYVDKALSANGKKIFYYLDTKALIFLAQGDSKQAMLFFEKAEAQRYGIERKVLLDFYQNWMEIFRKNGNPDKAEYARERLEFYQKIN